MGNLRYFIIFSITLALVHVTKTEILADGIYTDLVLDAVTLKYYTPQENGGEVIDILNVTKFHSPGYVVVYCHGYLANPEHDSIAPILHSLVSTGKYNVVAIDWSLAAKSLYNISRGFIGPVGKIAFDILSEVFTKLGISMDRLKCIGHSLGAHVCGNLGKYSNGSIGQIVGLDPAKPLISLNDSDCLRKTDALHVIAIHTGSPLFGEFEPMAITDVYVHFGTINQRGCLSGEKITDLLTKGNACSHNKACEVGASGIICEFSSPAIYCNIEAIRNKKPSECQKNRTNKISRFDLQNAIANRNVSEHLIFVNLDIPISAAGTYIMDINPRAPIGMGVAYPVPKDYA